MRDCLFFGGEDKELTVEFFSFNKKLSFISNNLLLISCFDLRITITSEFSFSGRIFWKQKQKEATAAVEVFITLFFFIQESSPKVPLFPIIAWDKSETR